MIRFALERVTGNGDLEIKNLPRFTVADYPTLTALRTLEAVVPLPFPRLFREHRSRK